MNGDRVVLRLVGGLDHDATNALAATMNAAIAAGQPVTLELDQRTADASPNSTPTTARPPNATCEPHVTSIGAGLIRLPIAAPSWTIDVVRHRLCMSHDRTELRFVPPQGWIPIRSVTVTDRTVTAVRAAGHDLIGSAAASVP